MKSGHRRTTFVGSPCWMAPEVINSKPYTFPADVYSFGVLLVQAATLCED